MKTSDFDYDLPKSFIAQSPALPRDSSRLLVFNSSTGEVFHKRFNDIFEYLGKNDVVVVNRSKVIPARVIFYKDDKELEVFILKNHGDHRYSVLVRPGKFFSENREFSVNEKISGKVEKILDDGTRIIKFNKEIESVGRVPLPPYIHNDKVHFSKYQTVYSKEKGSVAAPTAGLHFTKGLIKKLKLTGVSFEEVVLHVGRGTFLPVKSENISDHVMHSEWLEISEQVANRLNIAKKTKKRIVAVGTTSVRVLESSFGENGFVPRTAETDIFIYPGNYKWKAVDALITNFHLPKSSLIMLVASFLENKGVNNPVQKILDLYELAKREDYRFYSFGDAMLIF